MLLDNMQQEDISLIFCDLEKAYVSVPKHYYGKLWERQILTNQLHKFLETYM
jgi:hypothetical protein